MLAFCELILAARVYICFDEHRAVLLAAEAAACVLLLLYGNVVKGLEVGACS